MANLITLAEFKTAKKLESLKDDDQLEALIDSVSQLVKTYCANSFVDYYSVDKVDTFNLTWDTNVVQLTESPVVSISSVKERGAYNEDYSTLTTGNYEYYFDADTDCVFRTNQSGFKNWQQGPASVEITYRAGYSTIPKDLRLAIVDLIWFYYKDEYKERRTIGSSSISNNPTSTQWRNVGFPDHIKRVLDLYKQVQI